jgi:hypothetical protein
VWLAAPDEKPELLALVAPAFNQTQVNHTTGWGTVPMRKNMANAGELPVIIECLLYYQQCYSLN